MNSPEAETQVQSRIGSGATIEEGEPATLSIGDLAERTGLTAATLRVWETRHGFPAPHRRGSGHRRYREADVASILAVVRHKDTGIRLDLAIAHALAEAEPAAPSVYAYLRRRHPQLGVHRLHKSTLIALSWAIEDEFCSKADRAAIYGTFQKECYYRRSQARWTEIARVSAGVTVFANFPESDLDASPVELSLPVDSPMRREWTVVCDSRDLPVVLTAWELPGQDDVPDRQRLYESMWSVDGAAVRDAARVCAAMAKQLGVGAEGEGAGAGAPGVDAVPATITSTPELTSVTALFNRMVAYTDHMAD